MNEFKLVGHRHNDVEHLRILIEAMRCMSSDRSRFLGDPEFADVPVDHLVSKDYARKIAGEISRGSRRPAARLSGSDHRDTTQVCVVDGDGNAVSMTYTLGSASGVITPGLGFMYNGTLSSFDPRPDRPGTLVPGKRRTSSMAPTIVLKGEQPAVVIGAPGGTYIAPAIVQTLSNLLDFGMTVQEAVSAPRIAAVSDAVEVSNRIPSYVTDALLERGYNVRRSHQSYAFGAAHALHLDGRGWRGGADPQRDGVALEV